MNNVERSLLESMENEKFQSVIRDDFEFADSLVDHEDITKLGYAEDDD